MLYLILFYTFFKIGLLGFGGGYGMLSLIQFEIVEYHKWLSVESFTDIVAISQATPGPIGINSATFVGYSTGGVFGAFIASVAVVVPSFILMYILIVIFDKYNDNIYVRTVIGLMHYVVIGLIASAGILLINEETFGVGYSNILSWSILIIASVLMRLFKINPILLIAISGFMGWCLWG